MGNLNLSTTTEQVHFTQEFQQLEIREGELHLRFYVTPTQELALPAIAIREVISAPLDRITPIPNSSPLLLGSLNLRGRIIWVVDLGQFLGETTALITDRPEIPVIAVEEQEILLGLAVDRISNMEWLDVEKLHQLDRDNGAIASFIRGEWVLEEHNNQSLRLLDQKAIVQSERWDWKNS